jgi:hypothetical protein
MLNKNSKALWTPLRDYVRRRNAGLSGTVGAPWTVRSNSVQRGCEKENDHRFWHALREGAPDLASALRARAPRPSWSRFADATSTTAYGFAVWTWRQGAPWLALMGVSATLATLLTASAHCERQDAPDATAASPVLGISLETQLGGIKNNEQSEAPSTSHGMDLFKRTLIPSQEVFVGSGVRLMLGLVRVYYVGLYVDPVGARNVLLSDYYGKDAQMICADTAFWDAFRSFRHSVVMHVIRSVDAKHVVQGLERGLTKRLRYAKNKLQMPDDRAKLAQLKNYLLGIRQIPENSQIRFAILDEGNTLMIEMNSVLVGYVESCPALCYAIDDIFLGSKPVSVEAKQSFCTGMERIIKE